MTRSLSDKHVVVTGAFFDGLGSPPDVLVNGAGTGTAVRLVDVPLSEWRRVLSVNLDGTFRCLRAAAPRMVEAGRSGAIVNISSINERWPLTGFGPYCASKAGVKMLTEVAAVVAFLASDDAGWITGRSITVDGGHSLRGEPDFVRMAEAAGSDTG